MASSTIPSGRLKILSWNIGLRGLERMCGSADESGVADTHGITRRVGFGSLAGMLRALDADVICLQEVKVKQLGAPERAIALAEGYDSYFSLCRAQMPSTSYGRYAGVATFVRSHCLAHRAEEGVTGALVGGGPSADREGLDGEGRCVITVLGDLAIVNVYVPAVTSDDPLQAERRAEFKAAFLAALARRCTALLRQGLRVLCIGDFNITPAPIDSARELQDATGGPTARSRPSREWLRAFMRPPTAAIAQGAPCFVDAFRALHPKARDAYTCFHVAAGADSFNFGSRIDLALLAPPPLLPSGELSGPAWTGGAVSGAVGGAVGGVVGGAVGGAVGSDGDGSGSAVRSSAGRTGFGVGHGGEGGGYALDDGDIGDRDGESDSDDADGDGAPPAAAAAPPLRLLACGIDAELQGSDHQPLWLVVEGVLLPAFAPRPPPLASSVRLGGQSTLSGFFKGAAASTTAAAAAAVPAVQTDVHARARATSAVAAATLPTSLPPPSRLAAPPTAAPSAYAPSAPMASARFKQGQLGGFLRTAAATAAVARTGGDGGDIGAGASGSGGGHSGGGGATSVVASGGAPPSIGPPSTGLPSAAAPSASAAGWAALFSRQEAKIPLCKHGEPCKKQTTRKAGPNQGRSFFSCVRAEGPRSNPEANCGYFTWSSDWEQQLRMKRKREEMAAGAGR